MLQRFGEKYLGMQESPARQDTGSRDRTGFVLQGPVVPGNSARVLFVLRRLYPASTIVVSTWKGAAPDLVAALRHNCDQLVLSSPPAHAGGSNRNLQVVSTLAGLRQAQALGVETVVKMRLDTGLLAPHLFELFRVLTATYDDARLSGLGQRRRIFVNQTYTKKYIPYHVSDILMLGTTDDLIRYWDTPLDTRDLPVAAHSWGANRLEDIGFQGRLPECYFALEYCKRIGYPPADTLADYWRLLRDLFVVMDDSWFDLCWFKRPLHLQPLQVDELVSHHFWQSLYFGLDTNVPLAQAELLAAQRAGAMFSYLDPAPSRAGGSLGLTPASEHRAP